ncbi:L-type lectin-domain containing receptor kinase SIT2-like isoform X2 [Dioscorea cayenensis subsp. rotundata]|uniref:non-specific serine/threonine protein kinase n=1 Tax=Dioscorea cayennensis subsp. rotundata TaxID=55577 RepID=A0AB40CB89_DIOCR|nr:L-type lectin-domain containing receptor kinase SIT2-like isoform X2 [Dioscorea cayenensis subsp. rotundata]
MGSASAHHTSTIANESQWVTLNREEISQVGKTMYLHYLCGRFIYCISEQPVNQMISQLLRVALLCHLFLHITASAGDHEFTFNGFSYANLSLDGDVNLASSGLLQLTNATRQSKGQAFYPSPLRFKMHDSTSVRSFSTTFVFAIVTEYPGFSSYGFTFCISPTTALHGDSGHYLGLFNSTNNGLSSNHIIGVEFDTLKTPEYHDIDDNHVGIDIHNLISSSSYTAGYYTGDTDAEFQNMNLSSGQRIQVWIEYDSKALQLNVTLAPFQLPMPKRSLLSLDIDLSSHISQDMYVGFTASKGGDFSTHSFLGWSFKMDGNANALDLESLPSLPTLSTNREKFKTLTIWLPVCAFLGLLTAALIIRYAVARRTKYAEVREDWEQEYGPRRFSYKELYQATDGFKDECFLGDGGFGSVYRGVLPTTKAEVAVKKVSHNSKQGMREFVAEVVSLGQLRHRNLVNLLGYCRRKTELILVYEFMPNGSLDKYLFRETTPCLDWNHRFRIIEGVASGVLYLHEEWVKVVIHRDIKASNVLLDSEFNARLGDFGLARLYDHGTDFQATRVMGTRGYLAPELARCGKATTSSDVYAFGVFLLEVACGRRPIELIEDGDGEDVVLAEWVLDNWRRGDILASSDGRLDKQYVLEEMELVLKLGLLCCHPVPTSRPSMNQAMEYLNGDSPLPEFTPFSLSADILASHADEGFDNYKLSWLSSEAEKELEAEKDKKKKQK